MTHVDIQCANCLAEFNVPESQYLSLPVAIDCPACPELIDLAPWNLRTAETAG